MISESFLIRPRGHLLRNLVLFARLLRILGIQASPDQFLDLVRALPWLDLRRREEFQDAARAMLVNSREQAALFDRAFDLFFQAWSTDADEVAEGGTSQEAPPPPEDRQEQDEQAAESLGARERPPEEHPTGEPEHEPLLTYSEAERLRQRDFAELSEAELRQVGALIRALPWRPELRRSRRKRAAPHGAHLDLRHVLRDGLRYGGETIELAWQQPRLKRRPLVVLCDVSGSMELYTRVLLQFLYALTNGLRASDVEAFAFGTRLTRITRQLRQCNVDRALAQAAGQLTDAGAGTRIGEALKTFNYTWARRVLGHGPTVLIISDGWDRGDLALLRREIDRLHLSCRRLIWLNPLLGAPNYQPLAQGIQTVLPYLDEFLPVHNLASIERLAEILADAGRTQSERRHSPLAGRPVLPKAR
jgi:uncharacterized protein